MYFLLFYAKSFKFYTLNHENYNPVHFLFCDYNFLSDKRDDLCKTDAYSNTYSDFLLQLSESTLKN